MFVYIGTQLYSACHNCNSYSYQSHSLTFNRSLLVLALGLFFNYVICDFEKQVEFELE